MMSAHEISRQSSEKKRENLHPKRIPVATLGFSEGDEQNKSRLNQTDFCTLTKKTNLCAQTFFLQMYLRDH